MKNITEDKNKVFWLAPIVVLVIGIFPLPLGYYTLSRLVVCASALYFALNYYKKNHFSSYNTKITRVTTFSKYKMYTNLKKIK